MSIISSVATAGGIGSNEAELSKVYMETQNSSLENYSAYVETWNDVKGAVFSSGLKHGFYRSPIVRAASDDEYKPRFFSAESVDYALYDRVSQRIKDLYAADAVATFDPDKSRQAIRVAVDVVEEAIEDGDFGSLNELLAKLDARCLRKITSVALLRTSFRVKGKVSKWNMFYSAVFAHLSETGQDPHHALRGLVRS